MSESAGSEPLTVHVWSDVACPWCYIGKRHLEDGILDFVGSGTPPVDVTFHSFLLSPDTPEDFEGSSLDFLVNHKGITRDGAARLQDEVARVAADAGLQFDFPNQQIAATGKAHQLLHLAYDRGLQYDLKERLLRAHFCEGRHVGRDEDLIALAADVGLDPTEASEALDDGRYQPAVDQDLELARSLGVTGVPFFVIDRRFAITGAQPAGAFREVLERAVASRESPAD